VIRLPRTLRRPIAVAGAALVGLAAALAISTPASAHTVAVTGEPECVSGHWVVTWTATSSNTDLTGTFDKADYNPANPDAEHIKVGAQLPAGGQLTETQVVTGSETFASLSVHMTWPNTHESADKATVQFEGTCKAEGGEQKHPSASFTSNCDGSVDVLLSNPTDNPVSFTVNDSQPVEVAAGGTKTVNVTGDAAKHIVVTWEKTGKAEGGFTQPDGCATVTAEFTCDRLILLVENPEGQQPLDVAFTTSRGDSGTLEVAAGSKASRAFDATEGFTVAVKAPAAAVDETFAWEKPDNCGSTLPKTGAGTTAIAGGAGGLLAVGAGLFLVARRRRIRFTTG
jgi:LPXTG-motif cell wall-anchored protein